MAMPFNMILVVTMYIVIYDFNKLIFLYIHVHYISLILCFISLSIKYLSVCDYLCFEIASLRLVVNLVSSKPHIRYSIYNNIFEQYFSKRKSFCMFLIHHTRGFIYYSAKFQQLNTIKQGPFSENVTPEEKNNLHYTRRAPCHSA